MGNSDDESYEEGGSNNGQEDDSNDGGDISTSRSEDDGAKSGDESSSMQERKPPVGRVRKLRRKNITPTPLDSLPKYARKTTKGGYAHTSASRRRIGQANAGNTPWNKGVNRSSEDRAKIAAGVRARNRSILLEKLKRLGLTEEEWFTKKKEIKYLRERIRRSKLSKRKQQQAEAERKLQAIIDQTTEKTSKAAISNSQDKPNEEPSSANILQHNTRPSSLTPSNVVDQSIVASLAASNPNKNAESVDVEKIFSKDVEFKPHSFGPNGESYDQVCPVGGPGGMICCQTCAKKYTWYLSNTVKDMEAHRMTRNGREVQELLKYLRQGRASLQNAYKTAEKKIPPLPKNPPVNNTRGGGGTSWATYKRPTPSEPISEHKQWNMTSTIDIGMVNSHSNMEML